MNEQAPPIIEDSQIQTDFSTNLSSISEQGKQMNVAVPWSGYFITYFLQGVIMPMVLIQVSVYLVQCLNLDWIVVTTAFVIIIMPVFLRPVFAIVTEKRPRMLSPMLLIGCFLVLMGSSIARIGTLEELNGLSLFTIGFTAGSTGATILNVITDSHIIRAIPLDKSAKINSYKKIFSFLGGAVIQLSYIFLVGSNLYDFSAWAGFFSVPAITTALALTLILALKRSWKLLPEVSGLPPLRAKWLNHNHVDSSGSKSKIIPLILLAGIMFLFYFPDGLFETPWENFIVQTYGSENWATYNGAIILVGIVSFVGFLIARRSGKKVPEWDLLWYIPLMLGYYVLVFSIPPFPVVIWVTVGFQIPSTFIEVRLLQSMQSHSYFKKAGLTFQLFMVLLLGGKFVGISISGELMRTGGYPQVFISTFFITVIMFSFLIAYWLITRNSVSPTKQKLVR